MESRQGHRKWIPSLKKEWITHRITNETVAWAESFGHYLADGLKRTENGEPIQATDRDGQLKTKTNKVTKLKEPEFEKQAPLTTSQLRKFFGEIRRMQAEMQNAKKDPSGNQTFDKTSLIILKPKLAYQVGREKDRLGKIRDFYAELKNSIDWVENKDHFKNFVRIVEAVVAYHKEKESEKSDSNSDDKND